MSDINLPPLPEVGISVADAAGRQAKLTGVSVGGAAVAVYSAEQMQAYAREAVLAERERCASICDSHASIEGIAQRCADEIRKGEVT